VLAVVDRTVEAFGGIDILVNNVGFAGGGGLVETSDAQWQEAFRRAGFAQATEHADPWRQVVFVARKD